MQQDSHRALNEAGFQVVECDSPEEALAAISKAITTGEFVATAWICDGLVFANDRLPDLVDKTRGRVIHIFRADEPEVLESERKDADRAMREAQLRWKLDDAYHCIEELQNDMALKDVHISNLAADLIDAAQREEQLSENGGYFYQQWTYHQKLLDEANAEKFQLQQQLYHSERKMRMLMGIPLKRFVDREHGRANHDLPTDD